MLAGGATNDDPLRDPAPEDAVRVRQAALAAPETHPDHGVHPNDT